MTHSRAAALAEILAEAENLKKHRSDGTAYFEKCDRLVGRINLVFSEINAVELDSKDIDKMKSIKEIILREEIYAQSSKNLRDPQKWLGSLDD